MKELTMKGTKSAARNAIFLQRSNYAHWCRMPVWELDEAIALSLGFDPEIVNWEAARGEHLPKDAKQRYLERYALVKRASEVGQLPPPAMASMPRVAPHQFLEWAKSNKVDYPEELEKSMDARRGALTDWYQENEKSKTELARKDSEIASLQARLAAVEREKISDTRGPTEAERRVARTIIITMAIKGYNYKLGETKSPVPNKIENQAIELGLKVDDGSVRTWLQKSAALLPKGIAAEHTKPNSAIK